MIICDKGLKWELIKHDIRSFTIPYCISKKKQRSKLKTELEDRLAFLYKLYDNDPDLSSIKDDMVITKSELEKIEKHETSGAIFRTKAMWIEQGEQNSKYFLTLEKRNYVDKLISQLQVNDQIISDPRQILDEQCTFYKKLYSEKLDNNSELYQKSLDFFEKNTEIKIITEEKKLICDENISEQELLLSLKELNNGKTPGTDGLTTDFYKFCWVDIKELLMDSFIYAFECGQLSIEQRRGIISLIPKKNKNRLLLINWRPISLLNTDYKLIAKLLARRLKIILPDIINDDQTGYIKGRFIGQNIRCIEDLISFTEVKNRPGIILLIDFEKAFDSLNWNFMKKALEKFNFGSTFIKWISTLYTNIQSTVINNGHSSDFFALQRGIRQGCPLSAYLFIIAVEILAQKIRADFNIKGIKIQGKIIKISQLADDTTCFLQDMDSLNNVINIFQLFEKCSGLKLNLNKTKAKYIGTLKNNDYYPHGLSWLKENDYIESLGVVYASTDEDNYVHNFKPRLIKLRNILQIWKQRDLSLKGKITVLNNLALSPLVYISSVISTPQQVITEVHNLMRDFLWGGKKPKIAFDTLTQEINKGGLKLCNFQVKIKSLLLSWVKRLLSDHDANWKSFPQFFYNSTNLYQLFECKGNKLESCTMPSFYQDIYNNWVELHSIEPTDVEQVCNEYLWNNRYITICNKPIHWKAWQNNGILYIKHLLNTDGEFLSQCQLKDKYGINCNFLQLLQIRQSIQMAWRKMLQSGVIIPENEEKIPGLCLNIQEKQRDLKELQCKDFYWAILNKQNIMPTCMNKWTQVFPNFQKCEMEIWSRIFTLSFKITTETKLQSFQYKLVHRVIPCNKWLNDIRIKDSSKCSYCDKIDNLTHFFIHCEKTS